MSIIKNQESDEINIIDEQQKYLESFQESNQDETVQQKTSLMDWINKNKFWIISCILFVLLVIMAIKSYSSSKLTSNISDDIILPNGSITLFEIRRVSLSEPSSGLGMTDFTSL